jgi:hypothetical protein
VAGTLVRELQDFRMRVTESANDVFDARAGAHYDLVLSLACAA